jgi:hypothetical protein
MFSTSCSPCGFGDVPDIAAAETAVASREAVGSLMERDIAAERGKLDRRIADLRARERQYLAEFERRVEEIRNYYQHVRGVLL